MGEFVWFDLRTEDAEGARAFYAQLLGWEIGDEGMIASANGPWAAIGASEAGRADPTWVPYVQVDDVDQATERARELGATVLQEKTAGPAGDYTTITDPSGAALALWQPAGR